VKLSVTGYRHCTVEKFSKRQHCSRIMEICCDNITKWHALRRTKCKDTGYFRKRARFLWYKVAHKKMMGLLGCLGPFLKAHL